MISTGRTPWSAALSSSCRLSLVPALLVGAVALAGPPAPVPRDKAADRAALKKTLLELAQRAPFSDARLGVQLVSLDDGSVVFSRDADALLNPASNVKLVTAAAALAKLGPEYRFDTEFLVEPGPTDRVRRSTSAARGPEPHHRAAPRHRLRAGPPRSARGG